MKKKVLVILASILIISSFSACENKVESKAENHSLINYTDTGDSSLGINSKTEDIEFSSSYFESDSALGNDINSYSSKDKYSVPESDSFGSSSSDNSSNIVSNTVNTITYYYNYDSDTDSSSSQTTSHEEESRLTTDTDTDTNVTDTDVVQSQPMVDDPISFGSYSEEDIAFYINGEKIYLNDDIESVIDIVGEPNDSDNDMYYYDEFSLTIDYTEDGTAAYVDSIQIFGDSLETEKGIRVGMPLEDVVRVYGNSSTVTDGEHRYYVGNQYMYFDIQNSIVADIGYRIDHEVDNETE